MSREFCRKEETVRCQRAASTPISPSPRWKLLRLGGAYAEGVLPKDHYLTLRTETEAQLAGIRGRLEDLTRDLSADIAELRGLIEEATAGRGELIATGHLRLHGEIPTKGRVKGREMLRSRSGRGAAISA